MWTNERTDITKLIVAFSNFAKAPKNVLTEKFGLASDNLVELQEKYYLYLK
jgi:hypothetical protein